MDKEKTELLLAQQQAILIQKIEELSQKVASLEKMLIEEREMRKQKIMIMNTAKKSKHRARILKIKHLLNNNKFLNTYNIMKSAKVSRVTALKLMKEVAKDRKFKLVKRLANKGGYFLTINKANR